ncbi:hypothetical protein VE03_10033 [Pseudogymnoascus sp. 23342-1-I1]|nr:hypothetical protein VE03_10033 [Pseudogymnoascus sp. 23342-1-I1]
MIIEGQPSQDDYQLMPRSPSVTDIETLDRPLSVISELLPSRERPRSPILQGALDPLIEGFGSIVNQPQLMITDGQSTQGDSSLIGNSQLVLQRPPALEIEISDGLVNVTSELLPSRERARSPIPQGALDFSSIFNQPQALRLLTSGNTGPWIMSHKMPKIVHTMQKRFLRRRSLHNRNISQQDQNMLGTSNENRLAVVIHNSVMQHFESAAVNSHGASPSPFLVKTSPYHQTNVELEPVVPGRKIAVKRPITIFEYNGNQLKPRTIHNAALRDEFLLKRENN